MDASLQAGLRTDRPDGTGRASRPPDVPLRTAARAGADAPDFLGWVSRLSRDHATALAYGARREGLGPEDALDAVQEAFHTLLSLPRARALVADDVAARRLLVALVRNAARNMRHRHHRALPHEALDDALELAGEETPVDELIERAEAHLRMLGCVSRLGELQRRVVTLRTLDELFGGEAAEALGLAPGHVAVLLHRARKALLECMVG